MANSRPCSDRLKTLASVRTEITELATGLGMLGYDNPTEAICRLPEQFVDVTDKTWEQFAHAVDESLHRVDFAGAYRNGQVFLEASDGLRAVSYTHLRAHET